MIRFILNEKTIATDLPPGMVMLDFIRYQQQLTGTKIGCREGDCGACTILVGEIVNGELNYKSMTSCLMPIGNAQSKHIVSIEGINFPGSLNPVQQAMADCGATQCGFCTPGFVVSLAGFCLSNAAPTKENAIKAIDGNICRCTGYKSIEKAAAIVAETLQEKKNNAIEFVTTQKILPPYFSKIKQKLLDLQHSELQTPNPELRTPNSELQTPNSELLTPNSKLRTHLVGGGTDLYVQKHEEMTNAAIRFVFDRPEMNGISREGNKCIMGSSVTVTDLLASPIINKAIPDFHRYAKLVSSTPIRNMATIAGNFINASPIGDFTIFFLALDAQLVVSDGTTRRELALRKLYKGYKTLDKKPEEHIEQIWFELPAANTFFHFEKVSKRTHLDIASVNSAICLTMNGDKIEKASLSAGGVGPIPLFLEKTAAFLEGKQLTDALVQEAIAIMRTEISPISDARGTKEYKTLLLEQLIKAHALCLSEERAKAK